MIKSQTDAIIERGRRKAGVYYSHARGSKKNYVVNVPDYDNDRPDRIIPLIKMTNAREAQDYYETWTSEHRRQYEERLSGNTETEQAKTRAEEDARRNKRTQELQYKFDEAQRRVQAKDEEIQSLNAIAGQSGKAYAREREKRERLQAELEAVREELKNLKEQASVKEQEKLKREALSRKKEIELLRRELEIARAELKRMESGELREQFAAKERTVATLQDRLADLTYELNSERGRHAGEVRCLEQQKTMLEQALEDSPVSKYRRLKLISVFAVIAVALFIMGSVIVSVSRQKHLNDVTYVIGDGDTDASPAVVTDSLPVADLSVEAVTDSIFAQRRATADVLQAAGEQITKTAVSILNLTACVLLFMGLTAFVYGVQKMSSFHDNDGVGRRIAKCGAALIIASLLLFAMKAVFFIV